MKQNQDRLQLDRDRGKAARFFCENYSREQRYLIILSRDLAKEFGAITSLGIMKAESVLQTDLKDAAKQIYFDFLSDFESLKEKMIEFRWTAEKLAENGIDFKALRKLYFAVAQCGGKDKLLFTKNSKIMKKYFDLEFVGGIACCLITLVTLYFLVYVFH